MTPRRLALPLAVAAFAAILLAPAPPGVGDAGGRLLAVTALIAILWITEAIPIAVTSALPLVLFPVLRIQSAGTTAKHYAADVLMLLAGAFVLALGIERSGLHRRLALVALTVFGSRPRRLVLGFMATTAGLSLWISNTASTLLMLPIALAIVAGLEARGGRGSAGNLPVALLLGIAYAASIGGMGTIVGTPPNAICIQAAVQASIVPPTFAQWMAVGVPLVVLYVPAAWFILVRVAVRVPAGDPAEAAESARLIADERRALGPMRSAERRAAAIFGLAALAWVFRADLAFGPGFAVPGWAPAVGLGKFVDDSTVAVAAAVLLFLVPEGPGSARRLMDWETLAKGFPWDMIVLFGGGLALAGGFETTGLSAWIASRLGALSGAEAFVVIGATATIAVFTSEIASNTALAALLMPILRATAGGLGIEPMPLMMAGALAASCGFMMPVATAPNAIVYGTGRVPVRTMVRAGLLLDLIGIVLVTLVCATIAVPLLGRR